MTFKELDIFFKLCEETNLSNVAKKLNMTQSAISISLNSLEKKLDEKLFDRIGRKLILNERGRFFKEKSYKPFLDLIHAKESFSSDRLKGDLKIAASKTFNSINISQCIYKFISNHEIHITKHSINTKEILDSILNSSIDIGFVESDFNEANIIKEKVANDSLIIVSSNKELTKKEYYIDQLYKYNWLLREKGSATREVFLSKLKYQDEMNIIMEISNFEEIKNILLNNKETITCISKLAVKEELEKKKLFEIKIKNLKFERELFMVYHKNKYKSKLFLEFKSYIKNCFENFS
ncbi:LysR family transcriptional regulator [Halarcobacter bivalviorum]|uniref:LysR family transcriptional regulator n=1 Tax=Halarcobacter bivalviorum TaxID=663364 RepID=A0AAX2A5P1_9BACT|nr:LysR family transcriptional regulator [Halarcobacter bivalviorum]